MKNRKNSFINVFISYIVIFTFSLMILTMGCAKSTTPTETEKEILSSVKFSLVPGNYNEPITVEITCEVEGIKIRYTLGDGTQDSPTATTGTEYTGSLTLNETTTIKAMAIKEGYNNSAVLTGTFTLTLNPEINIKQGSTDIWHSSGSYDFTAVSSGSPTSTTFTIENSGYKTLTLGAITVSDVATSHGQITISGPASSSIPISDSVTFAITLSSTSNTSNQGDRRSWIFIENDDPDEDPYKFLVFGNCIS